MSLLFITLKLIINFFLSVFYILFSIIFGNFTYGMVLSILGKDVPGPQDDIHIKLAILFAFISFILSILLRKYLYLSVIDGFRNYVLGKNNISDKAQSDKKEEKKSNDKGPDKNDDDLEIYVNKEIK